MGCAGGGAQPDPSPSSARSPGGSETGGSGAGSLCILGIDPGSRITGYGVLRSGQGRVERLASGCIRARGDSPAQALASIQSALAGALRDWSPDIVALEAVFVQRSARSALILGQARGAALASCGAAGVPVAEYAPAEIKSAVTGYGRADKAQVQRMVALILGLPDRPAADEADALAAALCHAQRTGLQRALEASAASASRPVRSGAPGAPGAPAAPAGGAARGTARANRSRPGVRSPGLNPR